LGFQLSDRIKFLIQTSPIPPSDLTGIVSTEPLELDEPEEEAAEAMLEEAEEAFENDFEEESAVSRVKKLL
jgi:hypothetical protein